MKISVVSQYANRPEVKAPQFGNQSFARLMFRTLEKNPIGETLAKDVLGFNVPKFALSRTFREFLDIVPIELGNTAITALSTVFLPPLLRYPVKYLSGVKNMSTLAKAAGKNLSSQAKLARLGVSFGFALPFAAGFWALPFLRNWLTIKHLKTASFESLIAMEQVDQMGHKHKSLKAESRYQMRKALEVIGIGVALGVASVLGFSYAARRVGTKSLSKGMNRVFHLFDLKGAKANQIAENLPTFMFWSAPAYLGWIHAARGRHERREQAIKGINSCAWFFLATPFVNKTWFVSDFNKLLRKYRPAEVLRSVPTYEAIDAMYKGPLLRRMRLLKDRQYGVSFAITILMLSMSPQILNIFLTKKRLEEEKKRRLARLD